MSTDPIQKMLDMCELLIEIIEQTGACPELTNTQRAFSKSVEKAMQLYNDGQIKVDIRSLPPVMYSFAVEELPILCQGNTEDLKKAKQQLRLFMVTVEELIRPRILEENSE